MRLIDADAYMQKIKADPLYPLIERYGVEGTIEAMPTIEAEPVRQGRWIIDTAFAADVMSGGTMVLCSECGGGSFGRHNYCPHCGAKMDEEAEQ